MKKHTTLFLSFLLLLNISVKAQKAEIPEEYNRSATTWILLVNDTERNADVQIEEWKKVAFSEKFYDNNLDDYRIIKIPNNEKNVQAFVESKLQEEKIANHIVAKWYNRQDDGSFNMDIIHERGLYNAIDEDILKASNTKRGLSEIKDFGNQLINKSYIVVVDFYNFKTAKELNSTTTHGWKANYNSYVYKLDFNEEVQYSLYDNGWIYEEDDEATKAQKRDAFFAMNIPLKTFVTKSALINKTQPNPDTKLGKFVKQKSDDQLLKEIIPEGVDNTVFLLTKDHEEFRVKTTLKQKNPLSAKIGKKEDIKVDHRFFVYEYQFDEKKNEQVQKRKGVVRAKKVVDNRKVATGTSPMSTFYQTSGGGLDEGMLLQQRLDYGIAAYLGFEAGEGGGLYGQVSYRLGTQVGIPALYAFGEGGTGVDNISDAYIKYGVGLTKGFYFARNFEFMVSASYGWEEDVYEYQTNYIKPSVSLAVNLLHNFHVYGSVGSYISTDAVYGRGGLAAGFGVRALF